MGFDPQKLLSQSSLNPAQKISAAVNSRASSLTSGLTGSIASKLSAAGKSLSTVTAFAAAKTDALLSAAPEAFSAMAALGGGAPAIERISRIALMNSRMGGSIGFDPQSVIPRAAEESGYSDTTIYPPELANMDYYFKMEFMEYKRPSLTEAPQSEVRFSITLPIPTTLIEAYGVAYSEGKYGATLGNVINAIDRGGDQSDVTVGTGLGVARGAGQSAAAQAVAGKLAPVGIDAEGLSGVFDQTLGSIINPHLSMFFQGPTLREHQFNWMFAPKNQKDSKGLKEIYYRIKRSALPTFTSQAAHTTLEYPMMVKLRIMTKGEDLYPFKICVIPAASLNYAPGGTPAFHTDGKAVLMALNLSFKEIEYFTSDDILKEQGADYSGFEGDFAQNPNGTDALEGFFNQGVAAANTLMQSAATAASNIFGGTEEPNG